MKEYFASVALMTTIKMRLTNDGVLDGVGGSVVRGLD